jgi:Gamma tubulin complex component C-terminal/Gamma tubulin complex component N-terminal
MSSSNHHQHHDIDDAMARLVVAVLGHADPVATSLSRRVLMSQLGSSWSEDDDLGEAATAATTVLSSTWRRMARKATDDQCCSDVEALYTQWVQQQATSSPVYPSKMLAVLTKLMGKRLSLPAVAAAATETPVTASHSTTARRVEPTLLRMSNKGVDEASPAVLPRMTTPSSTTTRRATAASYDDRPRSVPPITLQSAPPSASHVKGPVSRQGGALRPQPSNRRPTITTTSAAATTASATAGTPLAATARTRGHPPHHPHPVEEEKRALEKEEALLLRECLYSLQGIDGERIRYYHKENQPYDNHHHPHYANGNPLMEYDGIRVQSPALSLNLLYTGRVLETRLGTGAMDALRISAEAGWLYQRIQSYIQFVQQPQDDDVSMGVVARAFAGTLGQELGDYHSLLTQYESQLAHLSLRQLLVDLRMPTSRLHVLALLADGLRHLSGGNLLTGLHRHAQHGDTRHSQLAQTLLVSASRPWFDILFTWTTQGVLSDPHGEFFVTERTTVEDRHLWNDKYRINKDQIPEGILPLELVGQILNVGKGINFIRRCLLDSRWSMHITDGTLEDDNDDNVTTASTSTVSLEQLGFVYQPNMDVNAALEKTLEQAATIVHSHILRTLREENRMMQHLFALKQFLFLGQGDFFSALMDGLHSEFRDRPSIVGIYKHSLYSIVENALRSTNAKYLPQFVLDRLQVELLVDSDDMTYGMFGPSTRKDEENPTDARTVWDVFMLDYQVPDPLRAIVHPRNMDKYKTVFSLLFGLRRIEFMLNFTWRQSATLHHALQTYGRYNGINIQNSPAFAEAYGLLRKISILRQNMIHLTVNLKSYFMFEVVEGGWQKLQTDIEAARTLDEVIEAHDCYIDGIVRKSLLPSVDKDDEIQHQLSDHVQILMTITGDFCDFQERLFHESLVQADIATQKRLEADRRVNQGRWGFDAERDIAEEENFFGLADQEPRGEVDRVSAIFNQNTLHLLRVLSDRVNANPDDLDSGDMEGGEDDPTHYGVRRRRRKTTVGEDELDSQRFLMAQIDHNNYFGAQGYVR